MSSSLKKIILIQEVSQMFLKNYTILRKREDIYKSVGF